jgi:hypothetical protein
VIGSNVVMMADCAAVGDDGAGGGSLYGEPLFDFAVDRALEREIDELVYAIYGLTPEEIKLVEERAKK